MSAPSEEYPTLSFRAVFWDSAHAEDGVNAVAHIEDALIVYLTRPDGLQVRLTVDELTLLYHFAIGEAFRQDEELPVAHHIVGCQSTNHNPSDCYGKLWQCTACGKTVCSNGYLPDSCGKREIEPFFSEAARQMGCSTNSN